MTSQKWSHLPWLITKFCILHALPVWWNYVNVYGLRFLNWGCSSAVERSLCMWKAPGSIPGISMYVLGHGLLGEVKIACSGCLMYWIHVGLRRVPIQQAYHDWNSAFLVNQPAHACKLHKICGSGGIRTHASEETGALNQRLRPLGHATKLQTAG